MTLSGTTGTKLTKLTTVLITFLVLQFLTFCGEKRQANVPGVVIDHIPAETEKYIGSPSLVRLPDGTYVASHDIFGPGSQQNRTRIFRSRDEGQSWEQLTELEGQWWSNLFSHRGSLYIMGTSRHEGDAVIRRSDDKGKTWTSPEDSNSGLLLDGGGYHTAPVPVKFHQGRIWRAMEDTRAEGGWPEHFRALVMSAPVDADLLQAENWTVSNRLSFEPDWLDAEEPGWLEGNVVVTPEGDLVNILRVNDDRGGVAAIVQISPDGQTVSFNPQTGFIDFPGGRAKFTIRYDPTTDRYWSLVNKQRNPEAYRNILALTSSADLHHWEVEEIILRHPDPENHAFQYVDWLFEGDDITAVSRTAWDGSHRAHDANYMTFHRIRDFRRCGE